MRRTVLLGCRFISLVLKSIMRNMERGVQLPVCFPINTLRRLGSSTRKSSGAVTWKQTDPQQTSLNCLHTSCRAQDSKNRSSLHSRFLLPAIKALPKLLPGVNISSENE